MALGYEDLNDHDRLRLDPLHALIAGKADVLGEDRLCEGDKGKALAAHSTLNRLELGALGGDTRYKKIIAKPQEIEALLIEEGVKAIPRKSREIILDFDATDDPLHGNQEGAFFHGYYRNYCYLPLYCFCGNIPLLAQLRDAKARCQQRHGGGAQENHLRHSQALWAEGAHHCAGRQRLRPRGDHGMVRG